MFKIVDAPSPRGTNKERLFVPAKLFPKGMAFDEAPAEEPKKRVDVMSLLRTIACMTPENWLQLQRELLGDPGVDGKGPRAGAKGAMDGGLPDYYARFPDAARIKVDRYGVVEPPQLRGGSRSGVAMDGGLPDFDRLSESHRSAAEKSFAAMYPGAMDIKVYR